MLKGEKQARTNVGLMKLPVLGVYGLVALAAGEGRIRAEQPAKYSARDPSKMSGSQSDQKGYRW